MTVSLNSALSNYTNLSSRSTDTEAKVGAALDKLASVVATRNATGSSDPATVTISPEAAAAAAAKADNAKDFGALSKEVRKALDSQYAAGTTKGSPDLSGLSGRALSAIALDQGDQFSPSEVDAAKRALRTQTRTSFSAATAYGGGLAGIANFSRQIAAQYDDMSPEERQARGWTSQLRDSSAQFASQASTPSLFDQINGTSSSTSSSSMPTLLDQLGS